MRAPTISAAIATSTTPQSRPRPPPKRAAASRSSTSTIITATARRTSSTTAATCCSFRSTPIRRWTTLIIWGHADERGEDDGEGATLNLPLPRGTGLAAYLPALDAALAKIAAFAPDLLVLSYGADTYAQDPISHFQLETADYAVLARQIAGLTLPTLVVMEGGYAIDALGANTLSLLEGLA